MMNLPSTYELAHNITVLDTPAGAAVIEFSSDHAKYWEEKRPTKKATVGKQQIEFISWGQNNDLPSERERLAMNNNIVPELLKSKRDLILGGGLMLFKERFEADTATGGYKRFVDEQEMTAEMTDFIEEHEIIQYHESAAAELILQNNIFTEFLESGGSKIASFKLHDCKYVRARKEDLKKNKPQIQNWLLSDDWTKYRNKTIQSVPNYNRKDTKQTKYIKRVADTMFGGPFYYAPVWWGSRLWIKLANCIPQFHLSNINNGYLIRYHIQFPKDYFVKLPNNRNFEALDDKEKAKVISATEAAKKSFMEKLNEILVGVKNVGRTIFTTYDVEKMVGKEYPGVKIQSINVDLKDKALLELFDKSNDANISAQGILPSLSGIQTGGKMSSGSDIRNALSFHLAAKTMQPRRLLYDAINHTGKKNWFTGKYKGAQFGSRDIVITTTDKEPTGMKTGENLN